MLKVCLATAIEASELLKTDAADRERRRRSWQGDPGKEQLNRPAAEDTWSGLMAEERRYWLLQALDALEPEDRDILSLHYLQQQSIKEVAVITGLRAGTVKVRLHRARERLRTHLEASATGKILQNYER